DPRHIPIAMGFAFAQQWARQGHACLHAALVQVDGKGVLILGNRAAGKSVLSASALAAGGAIISDDFLLAGFHGGTLIGERVRRFLSLRLSWAMQTLLETGMGDWRTNPSGNRAYRLI